MRHRLLVVAMFVVPGAAVAQVASGSIDPGMSRAQVVERLGSPGWERTINGFTYLLYENGCERTCGMSDLVTLQGDSVVDAIFRAASRRYSGESSSPVQGYVGRTGRSGEGDIPSAQRRRGANAFVLPAEWTGAAPGGSGGATSVDSIVLQITAAPEPAPSRMRGSILPPEWLDPNAPAAPPARDSATRQRPDPARKSPSLLPADWLDPSAPPAAATPAPTPAPPPAEKPRSSLIPAEWLDPNAPPSAPPPPPPVRPVMEPPPTPEKPRSSLLPAEWLDPNALPAAAPPPAARQSPPPRPDAASPPLIPAEWLNPTPAAGAPASRPDSVSRPQRVNPRVLTPPPAPPPAATPPPDAEP